MGHGVGPRPSHRGGQRRGLLGGNPHQPLTIFLYDQTRALAANYWVVSTGGIISIIIPLIVFFSFQRYFVRGMLAGGQVRK